MECQHWTLCRAPHPPWHGHHNRLTLPYSGKFSLGSNFRWVLIFAISRTVYRVAKIKTAIIYSNSYSKVSSFYIAKIKIAKIISHSFNFKSRKFSSAKFSRYTVLQIYPAEWNVNIEPCAGPLTHHVIATITERHYYRPTLLNGM